MKKPPRRIRSGSRQGPSKRSRRLWVVRSEAQGRHDAKVLRIEKQILGGLATKHKDLMDTAQQLVAQKLAPVDAHAARILLNEIRRGDLP